MNIYYVKRQNRSCKLHIFCVGTKKNDSTWVTHRLVKYNPIRQVLRSCLIWVYFICKRQLKLSPGLNVLDVFLAEIATHRCNMLETLQSVHIGAFCNASMVH